MVAKTTRNVILCHGKNHSKKKCPECGEVLLEKGTKAVCSNDNCAFTENIVKIKKIVNFSPYIL
jgi:uncharacterized Zn finger protein (UPF0148 family)